MVRRAEQLFRSRAAGEPEGEGAGVTPGDALSNYLASPSPTTCLVLVGDKPDLRTRLGKALSRSAVICELTSPQDQQLASWLEEEARRLGKLLRPGAAELLVQYSGNALAAAAGELEKLVLFVGEGAEITEAHVEQAVADRGGALVWAFTDAIKARDADLALAALDRYLGGFRRLDEALFPLLGMLRAELRMMLTAKEAGAGKVRGGALVTELAKRLGAHRLRVEKALAGASRFSREELISALARLVEADRRLKSSAVPPRLVIDAWVWRFCGGKSASAGASTSRA